MKKYLIATVLVASLCLADVAQAGCRGRARRAVKAVAGSVLRPVKRVHAKVHDHGGRSSGRCATCK